MLEAKAEGESFTFPHQRQPHRRMALDGTLMSDKTVSAAVIQAQRYAVDTATRFAVATNGFAFILFRAISEGVSWREGQAVVFHSYDDLAANFTAFLNLLSYESIVDGKLDAEFRLANLPSRTFYRPLDPVVDSDAAYDRNELSSLLQPYIDTYFGDIAIQEAVEVLEHCYVT